MIIISPFDEQHKQTEQDNEPKWLNSTLRGNTMEPVGTWITQHKVKQIMHAMKTTWSQSGQAA